MGLQFPVVKPCEASGALQLGAIVAVQAACLLICPIRLLRFVQERVDISQQGQVERALGLQHERTLEALHSASKHVVLDAQ